MAELCTSKPLPDGPARCYRLPGHEPGAVDLDLQTLIERRNESGVSRVASVDLRLDEDAQWGYARDNAKSIDARWQTTIAVNPKLFNGPILMMHEARVVDDVLVGRFLRTDFKSFLYWRESGEPDAGVFDAFGSALVWSADGQLMFARQSEGHINTGLLYMPGGFIDSRDVAHDGTVDIVGSVGRELAEETGLGDDLIRQDGFSVTVNGAHQISIGVDYRSGETADVLRDRVMAFIARDIDPELADVVFRSSSESDPQYPFAPYAQLLARHLLAREM